MERRKFVGIQLSMGTQKECVREKQWPSEWFGTDLSSVLCWLFLFRDAQPQNHLLQIYVNILCPRYGFVDLCFYKNQRWAISMSHGQNMSELKVFEGKQNTGTGIIQYIRPCEKKKQHVFLRTRGSKFGTYSHTLWLFNIAMENGPFIYIYIYSELSH